MTITPHIFTPKLLMPGPPWNQPGNTGNTGGGSSDPHGTSSITESLNISVQPAVAGPGQKWDTFYYFANLEPQPEAARFSQGIAFTFSAQADIDACEAVELQLEKCNIGNLWNMGWQLRLTANPGVISVFDYKADAWKPTDIPAPAVAPGAPIDFHSEHILHADRAEHVALWVNGARYPYAYTQPMIQGRWLPDKPTYLQYGFQFDSKGRGVPFGVKVDVMPVEAL